MSRLSTARRFAQAALALARERDEFSGWLDELQALAGAMADADLRAFFEAPLVPDGEKLSTLKALVPDSPALVHNLAGVLLQGGQLALLPLIAAEYRHLLDQEQGVERATVTTALPVTDEVIDSIRHYLEEMTGKKVIVAEEVAPEILGGFVAQVGDKLIDGSSRDRLSQLRAKMIAGRP